MQRPNSMSGHGLAALLLLCISTGAAAAERAPATFDHPDNSLVSRIEFPELRGDTTSVIRCAARVKPSGKMEDNGCYVGAAGDEVFIKAINEAARKARLNPARVNGEPLEVYVQYQVEFRKAGDEETVRVFNHPGVEENVKAYGVEHIAAQRGLTDEPWMKICPSRTRFSVLVRAHVSWDGQPSSVSFVRGNNSVPITERCRDAIESTVLRSTFTPAFADGEPVPSTFVEPFGS